MGAPAQKILIAAALLVAGDARADHCTGVTASGERFAKCFDLGNRLSVTGGTDGVGTSVKLRHLIRFDDEPDLVWKLEHTIADVTYGTWEQQLDGALYRGRFMRHARNSHIVLPFGTPKKIFLPFDIGAEAEVASVRWRPSALPGDQIEMNVVRMAALVDFTRTRGFRRRFAIGPVVRWDVDVDRSMGRIGKVSEHGVSPFTVGMFDLHFESKDGLWNGGIRGEAGTVWHTQGGWKPEAKGEAALERIMIAINDRPIAITAGLSYATATEEAIARIGARVVLVHRNDKRVNLKPLRTKESPKATPPAPKAPPPAPPKVTPPPAPDVDPPKVEPPREPAPESPYDDPIDNPDEEADEDEGEGAVGSLPPIQAWRI